MACLYGPKIKQQQVNFSRWQNATTSALGGDWTNVIHKHIPLFMVDSRWQRCVASSATLPVGELPLTASESGCPGSSSSGSARIVWALTHQLLVSRWRCWLRCCRVGSFAAARSTRTYNSNETVWKCCLSVAMHLMGMMIAPVFHLQQIPTKSAWVLKLIAIPKYLPFGMYPNKMLDVTSWPLNLCPSY